MPIYKNYHTHTWRCKHASQDVSAYCQAAVDCGITVLGISDHTALPDNRWPHIRMDIDELPVYCEAIDQAANDYPQLTVLKSAECEYATEYDSFFRDKLLGELNFDYLVGAAHFFPMDGNWIGSYGGADSLKSLKAYSDYFIQSMESGLFAFMAHPDLFGNSYLTWDKNTIAAAHDIFTAAAELKVPLEINGYGLRKPKIDTPDGRRCMYPWLPFWEMAAHYDILYIVNSDAHHPKDVNANLEEADSIGRQNKLTMADLSYLELAPQRGGLRLLAKRSDSDRSIEYSFAFDKILSHLVGRWGYRSQQLVTEVAYKSIYAHESGEAAMSKVADICGKLREIKLLKGDDLIEEEIEETLT